MTNTKQAWLGGVIKDGSSDAKKSREQNARTLTPEANNARWKDSPEAQIYRAYDNLEKALEGSTTVQPEELERSKRIVIRHQKTKRRGEQKIISLNQQEIRAEKKKILRKFTPPKRDQDETIFEAKPEANNQQSQNDSAEEPSSSGRSISLNLEEVTEVLAEGDPILDATNSTTTPSSDLPSENKPSLPPISPQKKPQPIRDEHLSEPQSNNQLPHTVSQALPQGQSGLKQQIEMIRMFNQARAGQMPGSLFNSIRDITTSTQELISGLSGGSVGPGAVISGGGAAEVTGALAAGGTAPAAAAGALGPGAGTAAVGGTAAAGLSLSTIGLIILAVVGVLLLLALVLGSGGGGNVANLVPTNEFLPLGTGSGKADPNVLYGDAIPIDVENPCWPVGGEITQLPNLNHGTRCGNKGVGVAYHQAIDIATSTGTRVYAPYAGRVCVKTQTAMGSDGKLEGYGVYLVICTDLGFDMVFAHLADYAPGINQGDQVAKGQFIAFTGNTGNSTGPHLHFEITNLAVCRPYNILDIVPSIPSSNQAVESCGQYLGSGREYEPI